MVHENVNILKYNSNYYTFTTAYRARLFVNFSCECFHYLILYSIAVNAVPFVYVNNEKSKYILQNTMCISELWI